MTLKVYAVIYTLCDDLLQDELENIYPTAESAIRCAKEIGKQKNCYHVHVDENLLTEEYGRGFSRQVYEEKHPENYDNYFNV